MPRGKSLRTKVIKADGNEIILQTQLGADYSFTIPKTIRGLIEPRQEKIITIKNA